MKDDIKVLVVGGGGREHTLVWKLNQSPWVKKIYCAPGNAGIAQLAECVDIKVDDLAGLVAFAQEKAVDLTVVGPEAPLVAGIVDIFEEAGLKIFGPSKKAAELEGSKVLAKNLMQKYGIPTARYRNFTDPKEALQYLREEKALSCAIKADGLAAGKGVILADDLATAEMAVKSIMVDRAFGEAGDSVVIEEKLAGEEVSVLVFSDGKNIVPMVSSQDHKPVFDGDRGPNTGGMGAYSPAPVYTDKLHREVMERVLQPMIAGLAAEGRLYRGVLYAGLMITTDGPKVLEFNCRFGDPETQAVLPRLKNDLLEVIEAILEGKAGEIKLDWTEEAGVCVIMASGGYPGAYQKGIPISGLDNIPPEIMVFHSGTALSADEKIVTNGGRVLGVTGLGKSIKEAIGHTYQAVKVIHFEGKHYRTDIGYRAL